MISTPTIFAIIMIIIIIGLIWWLLRYGPAIDTGESK